MGGRATVRHETTAQPRLLVRPRPRLWSRRLRSWFAASATAGVIGLVCLLVSGNLLLPFTGPVLLKGKSGSKGDIFADPAMQRILLQRRVRVEVTQTGSRELATRSFDGYDFLFPSGRPTAYMVKERLAAANVSPQTRKPFASPLVLASFRQYAETLVAAGIARPQANRLGGAPLYYTLDVAAFFGLMRSGRTWNDLGISRHTDARGESVTNGNRVLAHSPSMCFANSGEAYLALAAFVSGGRNAPPTEAEAPAMAARIKPLLTLEGLHDADLFASYTTPEGKGKAPIVVVYEHQYLAYQVRFQQTAGTPDTDRVLLYPAPQILTDPEFIALNAGAEQLGELLADDPEVRRRAMELGYRVLDPTNATTSDALWEYMEGHGIPRPDGGGDLTRADLPLLPALEKMIKIVGGCAK